PDHEFLVRLYSGRGKNRRLMDVKRVPAKDLKVGDILHVELPVARPVERNSTFYGYGFVFGDGSFNGDRADITICCEDKKPCFDVFCQAVCSSINESDARGYIRGYWRDPWFIGKSKATCPKDI